MDERERERERERYVGTDLNACHNRFLIGRRWRCVVGKTGNQWDQTTKEPKTPNRKTMAIHQTSWYINKAEGRKGHKTGIMGDFSSDF